MNIRYKFGSQLAQWFKRRLKTEHPFRHFWASCFFLSISNKQNKTGYSPYIYIQEVLIKSVYFLKWVKYLTSNDGKQNKIK
jgi:hypothetical protein